MIKKGILTLIFTLSLSLFSNFNVFAEKVDEPQITAEYALTYDAQSGEVIYSKGGDVKAFPASLTKLMSAILLTENKNPNDILFYSEKAKEQQPSSVNAYYKTMSIGEEVSVDLVLKSMLMVSANDMTEVAADNIPNLNTNDDSTFIKMMNDKAAHFKMNDTHFVTSNGLDDYTDEHLTTAYDLSLLANEAYKIPYILETSKIPELDVSISGSGPLKYINTNRLINPKNPLYDPTCVAAKTGYTDKAGKCLVAMFDRNGRKLIGVVLKAPYGDTNSFEDMEAIINYSYSYQKTNLVTEDPNTKQETTYSKNNIITNIPLTYKLFKDFGPTETKNVAITLKDNIDFYKNEFNSKYIKLNYTINQSLFRNNSSDPIGTLNISIKDKSYSYPIYSEVTTKTLIDDNKTIYVLTFIIAPLTIILSLISLIIIFRLRKKRKKRNEIQHIINKYKR